MTLSKIKRARAKALPRPDRIAGIVFVSTLFIASAAILWSKWNPPAPRQSDEIPPDTAESTKDAQREEKDNLSEDVTKISGGRNDIIPAETTPNEITPDEIMSDEITPDETALDETAPDEITSDEITPDEITSDEITSDDVPNQGEIRKPDRASSQALATANHKQRLAHGDYTVGWICALVTEYVAAQEFLAEEHENLNMPINDNNHYTLGSVGGHNVVIAVLPNGEYGISSATSVVKDMSHSFPNIRICLMVGIGGGAPSKKHDIRLGDVVVSTPRDGKGGVFQYDFGKTMQGKGFHATGFLNQPPTCLRTALSGLRAQYERNGHLLEKAITQALDNKPRLKRNYQRPNPATDRLYRPGVVHPNNDACCEAHCGSHSSKLISRPERTEHEDNPSIHYGLIASANQVMKDAIIRDQIIAENDVLCFEIEAAGLMNQLPCLVIRGICDYSDSHKSKEWQGYAAMVAAAYAKDLLSQMAPNKVEAERRIGDIVSSILDTTIKTEVNVRKVKYYLERDEDQRILNWLSLDDYGRQQSDIYRRRQPGTCQWILDSEEYQTWSTSTSMHPTLFCPGIPGTGKTILASVVVHDLSQRLQSDHGMGLAYIYFNFQRRAEQSVDHLLASLLKQLSQLQSSLPDVINELYQKHQKQQTRPSLQECRQNLQIVASMFSRSFIVIDALDECEPSSGCLTTFLSEILSLQNKVGTNLLVTCRPIPEIRAHFQDYISVEIRARDEDLQTYLNACQSQLHIFAKDNSELWIKIQRQILKAVDGMFLLAQLYFDSLKGKTTVKAIRKFLREISTRSSSYDHAYEDTMGRILGQIPDHKNLAIRVLSWIIGARRQLFVSEIQEALAVELDAKELDMDNLTDVGLMVSVCAGLVSIDQDSNIIRLVHYTTQEYFERMQSKWFPDAEKDITTICVTYLAFDVFGTGPCKTNFELKQRLQENKLYDYATKNWGQHAERCAPLPNEVARFLQLQRHAESASQGLLATELRWATDSNAVQYPRKWTGLHLSAYFGIKDPIHLFLDRPDLNDSNGRTPLSVASENGHGTIVKMLLDTGNVNVNSEDENGRTPLSLASENGYKTIVKMLLDTGNVDVNSEDKNGRTPLSWASIYEHETIVKMLLDTGNVDADLEDENGKTPLDWALENGHKTIVKMLLDTGNIDIDSKDKYGQTPLSWASENGHETIIKMLLDTGNVDVNSEDENGRTPLSLALKNGNKTIVKMLLDTGNVDVNLEDENGRTPLSLASENGHETIVKMLLDTGNVNPDSEDYIGRTPLSWASENGHETIIKMLLDTGNVDVDSKDNVGRTPLSWASKNGNKTIVKMLLDTGNVDVNSEDKNGRTPLSWASIYEHETIVKILLDTGKVDVDSKDNHGRNLLFLASMNGHETIVKMLLDIGNIDVDSKDNIGRTPLSWASENGHENIFKMLLATGNVDADSEDETGRTPLSWASENGHKTIFKMLLDTGKVDVDSKDNHGRNLLSLASMNGHETIVKMLLDTGNVDADSEDETGQTPLSVASENGHETIVRMLLDTGNVDVNSKDENGETSLDWALENGHETIVKMLLDTGNVDIDSRDC